MKLLKPSYVEIYIKTERGYRIAPRNVGSEIRQIADDIERYSARRDDGAFIFVTSSGLTAVMETVETNPIPVTFRRMMRTHFLCRYDPPGTSYSIWAAFAKNQKIVHDLERYVRLHLTNYSELSRRIGVPLTALTRVSEGLPISPEHAEKIARYLGWSPKNIPTYKPRPESDHPLRIWRRRHKITLRDLAQKLGISKAALCYIETYACAPKPATLQKIFEVTGIDIATLQKASQRVGK